MSQFDDNEKLTFLFKKYLGRPNTDETRGYYQEPLINNSLERIYLNQLYTQEIPLEVPSDIISATVDDNGSALEGSLVGKTSSVNSQLKKYVKAELTAYPDAGDDDGYVYYGIRLVSPPPNLKLENILQDAILSSYSAAYNVNVYKGTATDMTELFPNDNGGNWLLDKETGLLKFYNQNTFSVANGEKIFISFYRYVGSKGNISAGGGQGGPGTTGPKGEPGNNFTIKYVVTSVSELSNINDAEVGDLAIINSSISDPDNSKLYVYDGSSFSFQSDLSGVQGPIGPTGLQGQQGQKGESASFIGPTGPLGPTGPSLLGPTGLKGQKGEEFQIKYVVTSIAALQTVIDIQNPQLGDFAIINSGVSNPDNSKLFVYDGTEFIFQTDLSGFQGLQGATGAQGEQGIPGYASAKGAKGEKGDIGDIGTKGEPGFGLKGEIGLKGDKGIQGLQGILGPTGSIGLKGQIGEKGSKGQPSKNPRKHYESIVTQSTS